MSLLPLVLGDTLNYMRPSRILDQHFGVGLDFDDLFAPINFGLLRCPAGYYRPWSSDDAQSDSGSTVTADKEKLEINLDVKQFKPEEVTVNVTGKNTITVEGKHEEKQDEHGFVSRHFIRRYVLPDGHDINNLVSSLSSDGVLSITALRLEKAVEGDKERAIPIHQTGVPARHIEDKKKREE